MQAFTQTTSFSSGGLIGVEPMPLVTYSLSLDPAQGVLYAGTFINNAGLKSLTAADMLGVLAFDVDTGAVGATEAIGATIYTSGSFLESRILAANSGLVLDPAAIATLRGKNILLERSIPVTVSAPTAAAAEASAQGGERSDREREQSEKR